MSDINEVRSSQGQKHPIETDADRMHDSDCIAFLRWALPQAGLRWPGFRKVRGTVCKRVGRRMRELGLADVTAYRTYLADHPEEWQRFEVFCHIPISRFWRDRALFDWLAQEALPACGAQAARRSDPVLRCWSAGCASGEEPYSLRLAWAARAETLWPMVRLQITATDADEIMIARARAGRYSRGSVRDLPSDLRDRAFTRERDEFVLRPEWRKCVAFHLQDLRRTLPDGPFDLILCRNTVFTYFDAERQRDTLARLAERLRPGGFLIIGSHEHLPPGRATFTPVKSGLPAYRLAARS